MLRPATAEPPTPGNVGPGPAAPRPGQGSLTTAKPLVLAVALVLCGGFALSGCSAGQRAPGARSSHPASASAAPTGTAAKAPAAKAPAIKRAPAFDKTAASTTDPASLWVVVNKRHPLKPVDYAPRDLVDPKVPNANQQPLRKPAADALVAMFAAGKREAGLSFALESGYRSYRTQLEVYDDSVTSKGVAMADSLTARPGTSEHQTGLAADIAAVPEKCTLQECFGTTAQGKWLAANAWRFGFLLRYPADKVAVTGYSYEPWHFRYVGVPLATELHETHVETLEEFFGLH